MSVFRDDLYAGKQLVITGGASGIGLGISEGFAALGADVVLISRTESKLQEAQAHLDGLGSGQVTYHAADVRDHDALDAIAKETGAPDVLINAAAGNFPTPFSAMSRNAWESVIDIVLHGTANATRSFGEKMAARGAEGADAPSILNIVAGYAWTGAPAVSHSGAAKAGVLNLTKSLAVEWAPHVRLNAVSPGPIGGTEGMKRLGEDLGLADAVVQGTPLRRMGEAKDIADACLYLASPAAKYVTGACLVVDGGQDAIGPFGGLFQALH
ncbi:MAG: SDR family oxidoreductase [Thermoplasmatota archaeon]